MRQILLSSSGAVLARVPRPIVIDGTVLVKVHYSLVSTGTELAPLKGLNENGSSGNPEQSIKALVRKAPYYVGKAIENPGLAWDRIKSISRRQSMMMKHRLVPLRAGSDAALKAATPPDATVVSPGQSASVQWTKESASKLTTAQSGQVSIEANGAAGVYQVVSRPVAVPAEHVLKIVGKGRTSGGHLVLGVLSADRANWLYMLPIEDDFSEDLSVDCSGQSYVWLVWFLSDPVAVGQGAAQIELESFTVDFLKRDKHSTKPNEMDEVGWGVGYSAAGEVVAVGDGVRNIKIGDYVACGGAGQANHAEYITVRQNLVAVVPTGCAIDLAATCTVGAIALQGVRRAEPRLGETVCVVGLGLLGLMTCQMLRANGCIVLGLDPSEDRVARALTLGIKAAATTPEQFLNQTLHATNGNLADVTIITAAAKSDALINNAMKTTRRKGRVIIVGDVGLNMERAELYRKEIDVLISTSYGPGRYDPAYENDGIDYPYSYVRWTQNRNMQAYLGLIASSAIDVRSLIDEVVPVNEAPAAYQRLASSSMKAPVGVLLKYSADSPAFKENTPDTLISLAGHRGQKPGRIGYALVGAGAFGTSMLVPQMDKRKDRFDLRGVVSRDAVRGGNFARQRHLEILASDLGEVLKRPDIDLVVIATRHDQHAAQTVEGLNAGKHVFVEKPLALTWEQLEAVQTAYAARTKPALLMVGFNRRFAPAAIELQKLVAKRSGPMIIQYRLNGGFIPRESWIQGTEGGGRNLGEACHMYDFFRALTGSPVTSISANSVAPGNSGYLVNDNFVATLTYADGSLASLTYAANGPKTGLAKERIEVFCDARAFVLDNFTTLSEYPTGNVIWSSEEMDKGHFEELSQFGDLIASGAASGPISAEDIFETTAVSLHIEDLLQGRI